MGDYDAISEIFPEDEEQPSLVAPLEDWEIEIVEQGLSVDLGDIGGREAFAANARVRVTEGDGSTWLGLARLE